MSEIDFDKYEGLAGVAHQASVRFSLLLSQVWSSARLDDATRSILAPLSYACVSSSHSILGLVSTAKVWDADVLARTLLEGSARFAFMCDRNPNERGRKISEYSEIIPDIAALKDHRRVQKALALLPEPDSEKWQPLRELLLSPECADEIQARHSRKAQAEIERRWSIASILGWLDQQGHRNLGASALLHNYGMSSHLIHLDWLGSQMVWEREARPAERREATRLAHAGRLASDVVAMSALRTGAAYSFCELDWSAVSTAWAEARDLFEQVARYDGEWRSIEYGHRT